MAPTNMAYFEQLLPEHQESLLELHRRNLKHAATNRALGDTGVRNQLEIEEAEAAIEALMTLLGRASASAGATRIRVLVLSTPPGAELTLDNEVQVGLRTPGFVFLRPGTHAIDVNLPGYEARGEARITLEVVEDEKKGLRLYQLGQGGARRPLDNPVVEFDLERLRAGFDAFTYPRLPGAHLSIWGVDRDTSGVSREMVSDMHGEMPEAMSVPAGRYRVEGRWYPFFRLFTVSSIPSDEHMSAEERRQISLAFPVSWPLRVWAALLLSWPVVALRSSRLVRWIGRLSGARRVALVAACAVLIAIALIGLDVRRARTPPPGMVKVAVENALAGPPEDDPLIDNLRRWFSDTGSPQPPYGNLLAAVTRAPRKEALARFAIDRYEVTVGAYRSFLAREDPWDLDGHEPTGFDRWEEHEDLPVVGLSWEDASAYCRSVGKRLPTGAEWQAAAGGGTPAPDVGAVALFPWGNEFDADRCNVLEGLRLRLLPARSDEVCPPSARPTGEADEVPIGCWSRYGVCSMVGNAAEWVEEPYTDRKQQRTQAVVGGSWFDAGRLTGMVFSRGYVDPEQKLDRAGVRCARSLKAGQRVADDMVVIPGSTSSWVGPPELPYAPPLRVVDDSGRLLRVLLAQMLGAPSERVSTTFFLDRNPIREGDYQQFLHLTRGNHGWWCHPREPDDKETHDLGLTQGSDLDPVRDTDWWDAYAYCHRMGKRLPTRVELELSYRGNADTTYPWGDVYDSSQLHQRASPFGVEGLVDYHTEWTSEVVRSPSLPGKNLRAIRGGILRSELIEPIYSMSYFRDAIPAESSSGFRCAENADEPWITRVVSR